MQTIKNVWLILSQLFTMDTLQVCCSMLLFFFVYAVFHLFDLVLGRSPKRNRKSNILAAIEHNRNRNISKGKCDFDHAHFRCCTIFVVRSRAISSVRTVQQSRQ